MLLLSIVIGCAWINAGAGRSVGDVLGSSLSSNRNLTGDLTTSAHKKFQICEHFNETTDDSLIKLHGNGITVVTKLTA